MLLNKVIFHVFFVNILPAFSKKACRKLKMFFCPRGFVIPESVIADMLSARVADPLL